MSRKPEIRRPTTSRLAVAHTIVSQVTQSKLFYQSCNAHSAFGFRPSFGLPPSAFGFSSSAQLVSLGFGR